jgi:hypothetical protein
MLLAMLRAAWLLIRFLLLTSIPCSLLCMQIAQASLYNSHIRVPVPIPPSVSQKIRVCGSVPRHVRIIGLTFLVEQIKGVCELHINSFNV